MVKVNILCKHCGRDFQVPPGRIRAQAKEGTPVNYCSRECFHAANTVKDDCTCTKCGETKHVSEFTKDSSHSRGYNAQCKNCRNEYVNKVVVFRPYYRRTSIKSNARKRGLAYKLSREQFMSFWQKPCTYCGDVIETIGLDRVDNAKGYVMGNVVPCCGVCNSMKSNKTIEEFLARCRRIVNHTSKMSAVK